MSLERDFNKTKNVLFSSETPEQLISAINYINLFNKKHKITVDSPQYKYFDTCIKLVKNKIKKDLFKTKKDMNESDEFDWLRDEGGPIFDLEYKGFELWVDISEVNGDYRNDILNYIIEKTGNSKDRSFFCDKTKGVVVHCGNEDNDYKPNKNYVCFMTNSFEQDDFVGEDTIYIDGLELLSYILGKNIDESLDWGDKDENYGGDEIFSADPTWKGDDSWSTNPERSYWKQGDVGSSGGDENVNESDDEWSWVEDTGKIPNYKGHPQGVVYLYNHNEIDEFCDIIENYNGGVLLRDGVRKYLHQGFEDSRDELEFNGYNPYNALLSASFFVEIEKPGMLSIGYWGYGVSEIEINEWLSSYPEVINTEYRLYTSLNEIKKIFKDYKNHELIGESDDDFGWAKEIPGDIEYGTTYLSDDEMYDLLDGMSLDLSDGLVDLATNLGYRWSEEKKGWYE